MREREIIAVHELRLETAIQQIPMTAVAAIVVDRVRRR